MHVTLDQARTLDAFARAGTLQGAARALHKGHPAVLYALKQLELQTGLELFDRSGYRTRLTSAGDAVLRHCRELLDAERRLKETCAVLQSGWEPALRVVFDAVFPLGPLLEAVRVLREREAPTRVMLSVDSLDGVETRFLAEQAQLMVTVLPPRSAEFTTEALPRLSARLVAHKRHPLAKLPRVTEAELGRHVLLTVRGSDPRLQLATSSLDQQSSVHLSDFHAKKAAILSGIGFGWLPDWLIAEELAAKTLVPLKLPQGSVHAFHPRLAWRGKPGPAAEVLREHLLR
jgi:DNA-binding transcriptional LysR family regulator